MDKVNETIDLLCDWIQRQVYDDKCDTGHEVPEMVRALAALVSASANQKMACRMYEKRNITRHHQEQECIGKETENSVIESLTGELNKAIDSVSHTLQE